MAIKQTIEERFWKKVDRSGECWVWRGRCDRDGYGRFSLDERVKIRTHRLAWTLTFGDIPDGMFVCHNCPGGDNPACVNPAHLWLGTNAENTADRNAKGRTASGSRNGHVTQPHRTPHGERAGPKKLTVAQVKEIRSRYASGERNKSALGREYGVTDVLIGMIVRRKAWRYV